MLYHHNEGEEFQKLTAIRDRDDAVHTLAPLFVPDEHALVDVAREVDACTIDNDGELAKVLQAPEPAADAVGDFSLESPQVL